jgi:hypothetical protein
MVPQHLRDVVTVEPSFGSGKIIHIEKVMKDDGLDHGFPLVVGGWLRWAPERMV